MIEILHTFAAEETGGISALGLDPLALLAQAVTFLLLFWLVKRFALTKIVDALEKRRKTITEGVEFAEEMKLDKAKLEERVAELLAQAQAKADKLVHEGKTEASELIKQAETEAVKKMDQILTDAKARIAQETDKARQALEREVVALVAEATEIMLREKLTPVKDTELIKRSLEEARK